MLEDEGNDANETNDITESDSDQTVMMIMCITNSNRDVITKTFIVF